MRKKLIIRIWMIGATIVLLVLLLVARLYFLQIIHTEAYSLEAEHQYINTSSAIHDRGNIFVYSRSGSKIASATMRSKFILAIDPRRLNLQEDVYNKLNKIVEINKNLFDRKAAMINDPYEIIARELSADQADKIRSLGLSGIILTSNRERYYPGGYMAAHVLGFVGFDKNNNKVGMYGIERYYEDVLVRDSNNLYVNFFAELFTNINESIESVGGGREGDVVLTIDPDIQVFVEDELEKTKKLWDSKMTAAIVMNPQTGEILAMAVNPNFDVNNFSNTTGVNFSNPMISGVYEMGSIIKVLTMAIGLDTGVIYKDTTYNDKGSITLSGHRIYNYDKESRGVVEMQEILSQSLNTGAAFIAHRVGHKKMREYFIDRLSFGEETGIDLPAEAVGMISNLNSSRELEFATASFGQGVAFTPIATIRALAAVANGGYMVQPHMVRRIEYSTGINKEFDYSDQKERVFKRETTEIVSQMLTKIVDEVLAGGDYKMSNHSMSAKTGTAQIATVGGYKEDAHLHTFIGYGPSYNAEFIILLMNLEPVGARYASDTLTDPFVNISRFIINHLDILPDR